MAIGGLFDTTSKTKQQQQAAQDLINASKQTQQKSSLSSTVTQQKGETSTTGKTATTTSRSIQRLDPETIQFLKTSLANAGVRDPRVEELLSLASGGAQTGGNLADFLVNRAKGTQDFVDARTGDIVAEAKLLGERDVNAATRAAAEVAGGGLNTLVSAQNQRANEDLNVRLASLQSQLGLTGRQLESADLATAAGIKRGATADAASVAQAITGTGSAETANIALLANVLKGATESETGASTTDFSSLVRQIQESGSTTGLTEALTAIIQGAQAGTSQGSGSSKTTQSEGLGNSLIKLAGAFAPAGE